MLMIYGLDFDLLALVLSLPDLSLGFVGLYRRLISGISCLWFPFLVTI